MGIERYKGFLVDGSAIPTSTAFDWYSLGYYLPRKPPP
jgi:hypothetical protein